MKIRKIILRILVILVFFIAGFFIYAELTDYKPEPEIIIYEEKSSDVFDQDTFSVMLWNIGYCGMDASIDFFYDGGTQTRVSKEKTEKNLEDIKTYINSKTDTVDFILLQEVDKKAKRSYKINEYDTLNNLLSQYQSFFGKNYDALFIPMPITKPYGQVTAGLASYSKPIPTQVTRFQYPGNFSWPKRLFMLDRCYLVERFALPNGKELLIINLHNSAFDDGSLKKQQLNHLKTYIEEEYKKGNYLIIGGDWNQSPPDFKPEYLDKYNNDTIRNSFIPKDIFKNWTFVYSSKVPSNRRTHDVYNIETSITTVIDFFLISPNVKPLSVECVDLEFKNTDHQPVIGKFKLK